MSKKDFEIIAQILANTLDDCDNGGKCIRMGLASTMQTLQVAYPRFDESKFRAALAAKLEKMRSKARRWIDLK